MTMAALALSSAGSRLLYSLVHRPRLLARWYNAYFSQKGFSAALSRLPAVFRGLAVVVVAAVVVVVENASSSRTGAAVCSFQKTAATHGTR